MRYLSIKNSLTVGFLAVLIFALCVSTGFSQSKGDNALSKKEVKQGWKLLFDGKTTTGWRTYNATTIGTAWKVKDGILFLDTSDKNGGDIVTDGEYENFELTLEWKIEKCGNSGIIYNVVESEKNKAAWLTGPEVQILDNTCHEDAKIPKHRAGNLYDLVASKKESVKPAGEWNVCKIISNKGHLQIFLNGVEQVDTEMFNAGWDALIKQSKFKNRADFGQAHKGHLGLQDHGNGVFFKNIKIKTL